jgi:hypothetical protein
MQSARFDAKTFPAGAIADSYKSFSFLREHGANLEVLDG